MAEKELGTEKKPEDLIRTTAEVRKEGFCVAREVSCTKLICVTD
jgi:hypothetical protein